MNPKIDVDYVCALAHLELSGEEKADFTPKLIKVVEWVGKLEELKSEVGEAEIYSTVPFSLPFRQDAVLPPLPPEMAIANAPEKKGEFILVPKVIEEK